MVTHEVLENYTFFKFLKPNQLQKIARIAKEQTFESGEMVFKEGDHADYLYILVKGSIELFYTIEMQHRPELRKELLFGLISPGEIFGISTLIEPHIFTASARAAKPSKVIKIEAATLLSLCKTDDKLAYGLIRQIARTTMERLNATRMQLAKARAVESI